jgi:hypothetical protein
MGNTVWIDVRGRAGSETHHDMNVLHGLDQQLDALANSLGVTKLTEFYDYRELILLARAAGVDQDNEEVSDEWFDSTNGLATFKALRLCLETNWDALGWTPGESELHYPPTLMSHLEFCEKVLEEAVLNGQEFRLLIVP